MKKSLHFSGSIEINLKGHRSAFNYIFKPYRTCTCQFLLPVKGDGRFRYSCQCLFVPSRDLQNLLYTDQVKMLCIHKLLPSIYNICRNTSSRFVTQTSPDSFFMQTVGSCRIIKGCIYIAQPFDWVGQNKYNISLLSVVFFILPNLNEFIFIYVFLTFRIL